MRVAIALEVSIIKQPQRTRGLHDKRGELSLEAPPMRPSAMFHPVKRAVKIHTTRPFKCESVCCQPVLFLSRPQTMTTVILRSASNMRVSQVYAMVLTV